MAEIIELTVERAVPGGRMLAREGGAVVLVSGAIPGERVRATVSKRSKRVILADTTEILEASPDRRPTSMDAGCGGAAYAHIDYPRQLALKADVIKDAFRRIGRLTVDDAIDVAPSREDGYRLRASLHVQGDRVGFFREGTHRLCEAGPTGQLLPGALDAVRALADLIDRRLADCAQVVVSENVEATERVLHLAPRAGRTLSDLVLDPARLDGVTGVTTTARGKVAVLAGVPTVTDSAHQIFGDQAPLTGLASWSRHATSFFQGNRWLLGALMGRVLDAAPGDRVVDLYAGVGLFSIALAARGATVVAVEGDPSAGADLATNAGPWRESLLVVRSDVEAAVGAPPDETPDVVVVDPPRTGMSQHALAGLLMWRAPRVVYVSCDPPTLARDAARFVEAGYSLAALEALDLFPNTPHVETIAVFTAAPSAD